MPRSYLNSYTPLVANRIGREASSTHAIPPFVDGSIRREPDLENRFPAISCLCRRDKFAPRLDVDDFVGYLTRKGRYGLGNAHRRLTAVLQVREVFASHQDAAEWYRKQELPLPNNCMVPGNDHTRLDQSHQLHDDRHELDDERLCRRWDAQDRCRASQYGLFAVCHVLFRDLSWNAPRVDDEDLVTAFGRVPGTQNPGALSETEFRDLLELLELSVSPFAQ